MQSPAHNEVTEELVTIHDGRGRQISAVVAYTDMPRCLCILASPHPQMGGTMNNKLVMHLARGLAITAVTIRFDYGSASARNSIAASMDTFWATGTAPEDPEMFADAASVVDWAKRMGDFPLIMIGYSFGAFVAAHLAVAHGAAAAIYIAPALTRHDFSSIAAQAFPKLAIFSDDDFATPVEVTRRWVEGLPQPKLAHCISAADHFYRGKEDEVLDVCQAYIDRTVPENGYQQEQQDDVSRPTNSIA